MSKIRTVALAAFATCCTTIMAQEEQLLAFPGAEGFGRYATGGRGGTVYHVTNLDDSGTGSFRDAISQPNRIIVFDVSGVINLKSALSFSSNLTIAGQTAPGDGITLYGNRISISNKENIICRYLRVRYGMIGEDGKDAAGIADASSNMIFDHMSVTWGRDENFSINSTSAYDITIQNSILGQGLQNHSCGGLMQTGIDNGVTLFRNLYIDNKTRNPKVKGLNQYVNNVVYNWGSGACYNMGGESEGESNTEIRNNYFIKGPCVNYQNVAQDDGTIAYGLLVEMSPTPPFTGGNANFSTYCVNNYYDGNKDAQLNGIEITQDNWVDICTGTPTFLTEVPSVMPEIASMTTPEEAYAIIVENCGASLPIRDEVDAYLIDELTSLGKLGTIIQSEQNTTQFPIGGPGEIRKGAKLADTDGDGMPDVWEDANGTDKNVDDAMTIAENGYANIENYINSITEAQPFFAGPAILKGEVSTDNVVLTWKDSNDAETGYVVEISTDGGSSWTSTTLDANTVTYTYADLTPGTAYSFRVKAVSETEESEYSDVLSVTTKKIATVPYKPTVVAPENGEQIGLACATTYKLQWACEVDEDSGETRYLLYVGTSADNLEVQYGGKTLGITYRNVSVEPGQTYYWRVDAVNEQGTTTGDLWSFTTVQLVENDPIMYISADGNLDNTATKALELKAAGTSVDGVASGFTPSFVESDHEQSVVFTGESGVRAGIYVPYYEGMSFTGTSNTDASGSFSVSFWMKSTGVSSNAYLFQKGSVASNCFAGLEAKPSSSTMTYIIRKGSGGSKKTELSILAGDVDYTTVFNGEWHHFVLVRDHANKLMVAYFDGQWLSEKTCERDFIDAKGGIAFGNTLEDSSEDKPFAGEMDEMKLFSGALSAAEVKNLYNTGYTLGQAPSYVPALTTDKTVSSVEYYNLQGVRVSDRAKGLVIGVVKYTDGSKTQFRTLNK